jgi:hypothetical protein
MRIRRRVEVTEVKREVIVLKGPRAPAASPCAECATGAPMLPPELAAGLVGVRLRTIYRWIEDGRVHFTETQDDGIYVCLASLHARHGNR